MDCAAPSGVWSSSVCDLSVHFRIMFPTSSPQCHLCCSPRSVQAIKQACFCPPPERSPAPVSPTVQRPVARPEACDSGQRRPLSPFPNTRFETGSHDTDTRLCTQKERARLISRESMNQRWEMLMGLLRWSMSALKTFHDWWRQGKSFINLTFGAIEVCLRTHVVDCMW